MLDSKPRRGQQWWSAAAERNESGFAAHRPGSLARRV
jgi:hypothetical protein